MRSLYFNGDGVDDLATTTILRPNAADEAIVLEVFFNDDGVADLAVATTGRFPPYPTAVHVLLSQCE